MLMVQAITEIVIGGGLARRWHSHTMLPQTRSTDPEDDKRLSSSDDDSSCSPDNHGHSQSTTTNVGEGHATPRVPIRRDKRNTNVDTLNAPSEFSGGNGQKNTPSLLLSTPPEISGPTQPIRSSARPRSRSAFNAAERAIARSSGVVGQPYLNVGNIYSNSCLEGFGSQTSLLGAEELKKHFPDMKIRIFVGTWNMNDQSPPNQSRTLSKFLLAHGIKFLPDVFVVGTQESFSDRVEWEIRIQGLIGFSHVLYHSEDLGALHLAIFLRRDLIWHCSVPDVDSLIVDHFELKTKGAIAVGFILFGTSFLFVNSHLTAHQEHTKDRVKDLRKLNLFLHLPKVLDTAKEMTGRTCTLDGDFTDNFDVVFWCGDLNFRLEETREVVIKEVEKMDWLMKASAVESRCFKSLLDLDQLNYLRSQGLIFKHYKEDQINFPPTFKYDPGTNEFDTSSKQRVPSYTDRILYKSKRGAGHSGYKIKPLYYDSLQHILTSDHKPVWGMWEVAIQPGQETSIPLSGGKFNREVYLEGLNRRSGAITQRKGGPTCHVQ